MTKQTKIAAIIGAIMAAVIIGLILYGRAEHRAYLESKGESAILTKQYADYSAFAKTQAKELAALAEKERAAKLAAIELAQATEKEKESIAAALKAEKEKTAALPDNELSMRINDRIGTGQIWPQATGGFSITRTGANNTLNLFLDGESSARLYGIEQRRSAFALSALQSSERESANIAQRLYLSDNTNAKMLSAWNADKNSLRHLERSIFGTKVQTFIIGTAFGALLIEGLRAFGVIK